MTSVQTQEPGTQLTVVGTLKLPAYRNRLSSLLPKGVEFGALMAQVAQAVEANPKIGECTEKSIVATVATFASWGAEIGRDGYMIPYKNVCTPVFYYGYLCGLVQICTGYAPVAENVFEGDFFEYEQGSNASIRHKPYSLTGKPKGAFRGTYAFLPQPGGRIFALWIPKDELEAHRQKYSHQWKNGEAPAWYHPKTALKRLIKTLPKSPKLARLLDLVNRDETDEPEIAEAEVTSIETVEQQKTKATSETTTRDGEVVEDFETPDFEVHDEPAATGPEEMPLSFARALRLPGEPNNKKKWGGKGGFRLDQLRTHMLVSLAEWCEKQIALGPQGIANAQELLSGARRVMKAYDANELKEPEASTPPVGSESSAQVADRLGKQRETAKASAAASEEPADIFG